MVAIVSGNSLGLSLTSATVLGQQGVFGSAAQGRGGEQALVNVATGNLVLQRQDEYLSSVGADWQVVRTYNSLGQFNDDNADNWSIGIYNQPLKLTGTLNTAGSTFTRIGPDGAEALYTYSLADGVYVSTDGDGAYDTISHDSVTGRYVWRDGSTGMVERYEANAAAKLLSRTDAAGHTTSFAYNSDGHLSTVTTASGDVTQYDYTAGKLNEIRIQTGGTTTTRVRYTYEAVGTGSRLKSVAVDLTPTNTADTQFYLTTYGYTDVDAYKVTSISQSDGTQLTITYAQVGSTRRVETITNALGQTTLFSYDPSGLATTVTDPLGVAARYTYDAKGQIEQVQAGITATQPWGSTQLYYGYDSFGNVTSVTDGLGSSIRMQYDGRGNQTLKQDALGTVVSSNYNAQNQILTQTVTGSTGTAGSSATLATTVRHVYDTGTKNQVRFSITAEGRVTQHIYDSALGHRIQSFEYQATAFNLFSYASTDTPTLQAMTDWAAQQHPRQTRRTDYSYDTRGQQQTVRTFEWNEAASNWNQASLTQYVYAPNGDLLQVIAPDGATTVHAYDGLGRITSTTQDGANLTTYTYQDAQGSATVTLANGLSTVSTHDAAGRLVSVAQSSAGTSLGTTTYEYDGNGRLKRTTDPTGVSQWIFYDGAGLKVAEIDGTGAVTRYTYNANGLLTLTVQHAQRVTASAATTLSSLTALSSVDDRKTWKLYDANQRLAWQVDALGHATVFEYDAQGRITSTTRLAGQINTNQLGDGTRAMVVNGALVTAGPPDVTATATSLQLSHARIKAGDALTLTARVGGVTSAGSVTFYSGANPLGTANVVNGIASLTTTTVPVGSHNVTAQFTGPATQAPSVSPAVAVYVATASTVAITPPTQAIAEGTIGSLTATVTGASPSGTVSFFNGGTLIGTATVTVNAGTGTAVLMVPTFALGSHTITAVYSGDAANAVATTTASASVTVARRSFITLSTSAAQLTQGGAVTWTATVTPESGQPQPSGSVRFFAGATELGTVTLSNGVATLTSTSLAAGQHAITAQYLGSSQSAAVTSATVVHVVSANAATTTVLTPTHRWTDTASAVTLNARVSAVVPGGPALAGNVAFYDGTTLLGTVALVNGAAALTLPALTAGAHTYRADFISTGPEANSTSATVTVTSAAGGPVVATPTPAVSTPVTLTTSATAVNYGGSVTLTATVGGSAPTGEVRFIAAGVELGKVPLTGNQASLTLSSLPVAAHNIQAIYLGDANNPANASTAAVSVTVNKITPTFTIFSSAPTTAKNAPAIFTARLVGSDPAYPPTGNVSFYAGATLLGTVAMSNGQAALSISTLAAGTHAITVQYAGDTRNAAGTSAVFNHTVTPLAPTVSLTTATTIVAGTPLLLTANLSGTGPTPTGAVTFFNGEQSLGTVAIVNGSATLTTHALTVAGTASVTAVYSGDVANAGGASTARSIAVTPGVMPSVTLAALPGTILAGQSQALTATVSNAISMVASGATYASGTVTKTTNTYNWDASVRSTVGITGGASVSFVPPTTNGYMVLGLSTNPAQNDGQAIAGWTVYVQPGGWLSACLDGNIVANIGAYAAGDTLAVSYDGAAVKFTRNGTVIYQQATTIASPLYLDSSFCLPGVVVNNLEFRNSSGQVQPLIQSITGSVTFFNGQSALGTASLVNGVATLNTNSLTSAGSATINAVYSGDASNAAAVSAAQTVSVVAPSINLGASASSIDAGTPVTLTANLANLRTLQSVTATAGSATINGTTVTKTADTMGWDSSIRSTVGYAGGATVTFSASITGSKAIGLNTDPETSNDQSSIDWGMNCGWGTLSIGNSVIGDYTETDVLSVSYDGSVIRFLKNGTTLYSQSVSIAQPLYLDSTFYHVGGSFSNLTFGNSATPGGTVTFFNGQTELGTVAVTNGSAALTTTALASTGTANIRAVYRGGAFNDPMASAIVPIAVSGGSSSGTPPITVALGSLPGTVLTGQSLTLSAAVNASPTVVATGVTHSGGVVTKTTSSYSWDASIRGTVGLTGGASVSFVPPTTNGYVMVGLSTNPALNDGPSIAGWSVYVQPGGTLAAMFDGNTVANIGNYAAGDTLSVVYDGSAVKFTRNGTVLYQQATTIASPLYLDSCFCLPGVVVTDLAFKNASGQVQPLIQSISGSVTFFNGQAAIGTASLVNGTATLTTNALATAGAASITAVYSGDASVAAAASAAQTVTVVAPSIGLTASSSSIAAGTPVTLTANLANLRTLQSVTATAGSATINGTTVTKSSGVMGWDSSIRSTVGYAGGATVTFSAPIDGTKVVGLNTDPETSNDFGTIDWGYYCDAAGNLMIANHGSIGSVIGSYTASDILGVSYDNGVIRFLKNGTTLYSQSASITQPLYLDSAFYSVGSSVTGLTFGSTPTPGGTVTFFNDQTELGTVAVTSGSATLTTSALTTAGTANIKAVFRGGAFNDPMASSSVPISVNGLTGTGATATTLAVSTAAPTRSDSVILTASVSGQGVSPSGLVVFYDGSTLLGTAQLAGTTASLTVSGLSLGAHSVKAVYTGDQQAASSSSAVAAVTVSKATPSAALSSSIVATTATTVTLRVTARAVGAIPTGTMTFRNNGTSVGAVTLANGLATRDIVLTRGQAASITVDYAGDANNNSLNAIASTSLTPKLLPTVALSVSPASSTLLGTTVTLRATTAGGSLAGDLISFYAGTKLVGTAAVQADGTATLSTNLIPAGTQSMTARFAGNANSDPAVSSGVSLTLTGTTTTTLTASRGTGSYGTALNMTAVVAASGWANAVSGTVTFKNGTTTLQTVNVVNGVASYTIANPSAVDYTLTAVYNPAGGLTTSTSAAVTAKVTTAASSVTVTAPPSATAKGANATFTAQVTGTSLGGTVTFRSGSTIIGTSTVSGSGAATLTVNSLAAGMHMITASYSGNAVNSAAMSSVAYHTVTAPAAVTLARTSAASISQTANLTLSVSGSSPNGKVTLLQGSTVLGTANVVSGVATFAGTLLPVGSLTLTAHYGGDAVNPAGSLQFSQTVTAAPVVPVATTTNLAVASTRAPAGIGLLLSAIVQGQNPSGPVTFYNGDSSLGTVSLSYGLASVFLPVPLPALGLLRAVYAGDASNASSSSPNLSVPAPTVLATRPASTEDRATRQVFDRDGLLLGILDNAGYLTEYRYNAAGQQIGTSRYATQVADFTNTATLADRLTTSRQAGSLAPIRPVSHGTDIHTASVYNARGLKAADVDAEGYLVSYGYDSLDRVTTTTAHASRALLNASQVTAQTTLSQLTPATSAEDRTTTRTYDTRGRLATEITPDGLLITYAYDSVGNLTSVTRAAGAETRTQTYRYDAQGRLTAELDGRGTAALQAALPGGEPAVWAARAVQHTYDAAGRRTSTTDAEGVKTLFFYDEAGRRTHTVNALGAVSEAVYNAFGQVTDTTGLAATISMSALQGGIVTSTLRDRIEAARNASHDLRTFTLYNADGTVRYSANAVDLPDDPAGTQWTYYNAFAEEVERIRWIGPAQSTRTVTVRDGRGLVDSVTVDTEGVSARTAFGYDAFGRLRSTQDPLNRVNLTAYDRMGRVVSTTDATGAVRSTTFDAFGRVATNTDALLKVTSHTYNRSTRTFTVTTPEGVAVATTFNAMGEQVAVTDGRGVTTTFTYDKSGNLEQATTLNDAGLPITTYRTYDEANRLTTTVDAGGRTVAYQYDTVGRTWQRTEDPGGLSLTTTTTYDAFGRKLNEVDPTGRITQLEYDRRGRLVAQVVDPNGLNLRTAYTYDRADNLKTVTDPAGTVTLYTYDALGHRLSEQVDSSGLNLTRSWTYDKSGATATATDANLNTTRFIRDANGRVVFTVDARGAVQQTGYDVEGRATRVTTYANLIATTGFAGLSDTAAAALVVSRLAPDESDSTQHQVYDNDGRLRATVSGAGDVVMLTLDAAGNVTRRIAYANRLVMSGIGAWVPGTLPTPLPDAARDVVENTFFDKLGRAVATVDGTGAAVRLVLDGNGNVIERIAYRQRLSTVPATLSALMTALQGQEAAGDTQRTRFEYDGAGRVAWKADGTGAVSRFLYDGKGQLVKQIDFASRLSTGLAPSSVPPGAGDRAADFVYDVAGRRIYSVDATGVVTAFRYDRGGNLVAQATLATRVASPGTAGPAYDQGTLVTGLWNNFTLAQGARFWSYDAGNRLRYAVDAVGSVTENRYDGNGQLTQSIRRSTPLEASALASLLGQITSNASGFVNVPPSAVSSSTFDRIERRYYDAAGRLTLSVDAMGAATSFAYDGAGRLLEQRALINTLSADSTAISSNYPTEASVYQWIQVSPGDRITTHDHDAAGRVTQTTDALGYTQSYAYNGLGQKVSYTNQKGDVWTYTYDLAGRLEREISPQVRVAATTVDLLTGQLYVDPNPPLLAVTTKLAYDAFGKLSSRTEAEGIAGQERTTRYEYDAAGRQVKTIFPQVSTYDAAKESTLQSHTALNRALFESAPPSIYSEVLYDRFGNAAASLHVGGGWTFRTFDAAGRLRFEVDAEGFVTGYERNVHGDVEALTRYASAIPIVVNGDALMTTEMVSAALAGVSHAGDRVITTVYNTAGQAVEVREPVAYNFDATTTDPAKTYTTAGRTTVTAYNTFGEVTQKAVSRNSANADWERTNYYYDARGNQAAVIDAEGYLTTKTFDSAGQVTSTTEFATALSSWDGNWSSAITRFAGQAEKPHLWQGAVNADNRTTVFTYDKLGRKTLEEKLGVLLSGDDNAVRVNVLTQHGYDQVGNLTYTIDAEGRTIRNVYDKVGHLTAVLRGPAAGGAVFGSTPPDTSELTEFTHDAHGNVVATTQRFNGWYVQNNEQGYLAQSHAKDRRTVVQYDLMGHALAVRDANQNQRYLSYDTAGRVAKEWQSVTDQGQQSVIFKINTYDKLGRVVAVTEPRQVATPVFGGAVTATFTSALRRESTERLGQGEDATDTITNYYYVGANEIRLTWDTASAPYDLNGPDVTFTVEYLTGSTFSTGTDGSPRGFEIHAGTPQVKTFTTAQLQAGSVSWTWEGAPGNPTNEGVTALTRVVVRQQGRADVEVNLQAPPPNMLVTSAPRKHQQLTQYNAFGEIISRGTRTADDAGVYETTQWNEFFEYDAAGRLWRTNEGTGITRAYLYDQAGHRTAELQSAGIGGRYNLDLSVFSLQELAGLGDLRRTDYRYDRLGRVIGEVRPERQYWNESAQNGEPMGTVWKRPVVQRTLDRWGNVLAITDPRSTPNYQFQQTTYVYNFENRLLRQVAPYDGPAFGGESPGSTTSITYDRLGRELAVTNGLGKTRTNLYDSRGNVLIQTDETGAQTRHTYDAFGDKVRTVDARNNVVEYGYDNLSQLVSTRRLAVGATTVTTGWTASTTAGVDIEETQIWDEAGRRVLQTNGSGERTYFRYDLAGNLVESGLMAASDASPKHATFSRYDMQGRLTAQLDSNGKLATWTYDYFGTLKTHRDIGGASFTYTYDHARQLHQQTSTRGQNLAYRYDAAGQLVRIVDQGRETSAGTAANKHTVYDYDLAGHRILEATLRQGVLEQVNRMAYDSAGQLKTIQTVTELALPLKTDLNTNTYVRRDPSVEQAFNANSQGMTLDEYALWHYSHATEWWREGGANALSYATNHFSTEAQSRAASLANYLPAKFNSQPQEAAGAMLYYRVSLAEAAQALGMTVEAMEASFQQRGIGQADYNWQAPSFGGATPVGNRASTIQTLWRANMGSPRLMADAMIFHRISVTETAAALGVDAEKIHLFFRNADVKEWEYDLTKVRVQPSDQADPLYGGLSRWQWITNNIRTLFGQGNAQGMADFMRNSLVSPEEVILAAGRCATSEAPAYPLSLLHQYLQNNGVARTSYDRSLMAVPDVALYGSKTAETADLTQDIAGRWNFLFSIWQANWYTDFSLPAAKLGAQKIALTMIYAKITPHEMATVANADVNLMRAYFAHFGIDPINYDCTLSQQPGASVAMISRVLREADLGAANRLETTINYDRVGNRKEVITTGYGGLASLGNKVQTFAFDNANRQTLADGHTIEYDANGNRHKDSYLNASGQAVQETYTYDAMNRLLTTSRSVAGAAAVTVEERLYDAAGRTVSVIQRNDTGGEQTISLTRYDGIGQQLWQRVRGAQEYDIRYEDDGTGFGAPGQLGWDAAGNLKGYDLIKAGSGLRDRTTYQYELFEGYKQSLIGIQSQANGATGRTDMRYDANGHLVSVTDAQKRSANRTFVNDAAGLALKSLQEPLPNTTGQRKTMQLVANGEALGRFTLQTQDFNFSYTPISSSYPAHAPTSYTVTERDIAQGSGALQSIARAVYGDARLWFWIAEANNLASATELRAGQILTLPNRVGTISNNADTFKPYDPSQIVGDTTPTVPVPSKKGCGALGKVIMVVVAIAAAALTAGALLAPAGSLASTGVVGTMQAGLSALGAAPAGLALTGTAAGGATALGVSGMMLSAAVGSVASQVAGIAMGSQDGFSWRQVGLSALSAGVTAGMGAGGPWIESSKVANAALMAAAGSAVTHGIGLATGLQKSFDWRGVAASAVGAGVAQAVSDPLRDAFGGVFRESPNAAAFGARLTTGLFAGTAAAMMRGGKVAIQQVAVDAFGNALGGSLASASIGGSTRDPTSYDYQNEGDRASDAATRAREQAELFRTTGDFARLDGVDYRSTPYDPPNAANGLQSGRRSGLGVGFSGQAIQEWSDEITGGVILRSMRDAEIDAAAAQQRAQRAAAQAARAATVTSAKVDPVAEVSGFAQTYPALAREVAALERAVENRMLTVDQAREALLKSPRAHTTLRKDFEAPDVVAGNRTYMSARDGKTRVVQPADPRSNTFHYQAARSTSEALLSVAGPEAVIGNYALKGAVFAYGSIRGVGSEITSLLLRSGERSALDVALAGERAALVEAESAALQRIAANNRAGSHQADLRRSYQQARGQIDFAHIEADVVINAAGKVTAKGGHFSTSPMLEIVSGTKTLGTNGVVKAQVNLLGPDGNFYLKTNNKGFSTMTPTDWSLAQAKGEMSQAFLTRTQLSNGKWFGESGGVTFQFHAPAKPGSLWRGYPLLTP